MLGPLKAMKGYDDSGARAPAKWSYQAALLLRDQYAALDAGLTAAAAAVRAINNWAEARRREILTGDASLDAFDESSLVPAKDGQTVLGRAMAPPRARADVQRAANERRAVDVARYFREGDRVLNPSLLKLIELGLADHLPLVRTQRAYVDRLVGDRPKLVERGGRAVAVHRGIAVSGRGAGVR